MSLIIGKGVVDWIAQRTNDFGAFGTETGIGWLKNGEIVAGVAYADWNGPNVVCHIASDETRQWMTKTYLWTIFDYPFNQMKANRITVLIGEGNANSINLAKRLGFTLEAKLSGAHPTGDLLIFRLLKPECRWIKGNTCEKLAA